MSTLSNCQEDFQALATSAQAEKEGWTYRPRLVLKINKSIFPNDMDRDAESFCFVVPSGTTKQRVVQISMPRGRWSVTQLMEARVQEQNGAEQWVDTTDTFSKTLGFTERRTWSRDLAIAQKLEEKEMVSVSAPRKS